MRTRSVLLLAATTLAMSAMVFAQQSVNSGLKVGENVPAFEPAHVTGEDKGTHTCPACKYTRIAGVQMWVTHDTDANITKVAQVLDKKLGTLGMSNIRAFVVFDTPKSSPSELQTRLTKLSAKAGLKNVALLYIDKESASAPGQYEISKAASVKNTVFLYNKRAIKAKFVNLGSSDSDLAKLSTAVDKLLN